MIRAIKAVVSLVRKIGSVIRNNRVSRFVRKQVSKSPLVRSVLVVIAIVAPLAAAVVVFPVAATALWAKLPLIGIFLGIITALCVLEAVLVIMCRNLWVWYLYLTGFVRYCLATSVFCLLLTHILAPLLIVLGVATLSFYLLNGAVIR